MKNKILTIHSLNVDLATLLLRLIFGGLFVRYGYLKIKAYDNILPQFGDIIGIGSQLSFNLVIFAEFFCGLLVLLGFLTRLSVIPIFICMLIAYFIAHAADPFDVKTLAFIFMLLSPVLFILGSGRYSLDNLLWSKKTKREDD